ncbi:uncharacterized protein METZ01_LOCUS468756 [marine metagenome]|uniref:Uncharacterized protein n=1 Tax=marine metagenome TaxID=408172 RepID=A0A383B7D1_9ZZZZ
MFLFIDTKYSGIINSVIVSKVLLLLIVALNISFVILLLLKPDMLQSA